MHRGCAVAKMQGPKWSVHPSKGSNGVYREPAPGNRAARAIRQAQRTGVCTIEAWHEKLSPGKFSDWGNQDYTSARIFSKGSGWTYGFYEVRAKLPCARGTWPAIWMLPVDMKKWPDDGEIDIMEQVGAEPNLIYSTLHTKLFNHVLKTQRSAQKLVPTSCKGFPCLPARLAA